MNFHLEKEFNLDENLSLKTTRITSTDRSRGKTLDNPIELMEDSTKYRALKKFILRKRVYVMSVIYDITKEKIMKEIIF